MLMTKEFPFELLRSADLIIDGIYKGGTRGNAGDDPIARLLPVGNQGGFRHCGRRIVPGCRLVVLFSTFSEPDWPDVLDVETGQIVYFGDNRSPGHELHNTPRRGNALLRESFGAVHASPPNRTDIPPFFLFSNVPGTRDAQFKGYRNENLASKGRGLSSIGN
jgi:AspBHI-like restriction endonuclease